MGEIAEMFLDGTLCSCCGVYIGSNNGFATLCRGCQQSERQPAKVRCKKCGRKVKEVGLAQHMRDKHGKSVTHGAVGSHKMSCNTGGNHKIAIPVTVEVDDAYVEGFDKGHEAGKAEERERILKALEGQDFSHYELRHFKRIVQEEE